MQEQPRLNIDFKNTTAVTGFDGGHLFGQAIIVRKISKFLIGAEEDSLIPIPVFTIWKVKKSYLIRFHQNFVTNTKILL